MFLDSLAARLGGLKKGGELDTEGALTYLLRVFREGKLGPWTLDDLDGAEEAYIEKYGEERAPEANMRYSELGAVGVLPSASLIEEPPMVIDLGDGPEPSAVSPTTSAGVEGVQGAQGGEGVKQVPISLDQRVMLSVSRFMDQLAEQKADEEAGRNRSPTQVKKQERKQKLEERRKKSEAKRQRQKAALASARR